MQPIYVQLVTVWWTKASRGMPAAQTCARLPHTFPWEIAPVESLLPTIAAGAAHNAVGVLHTVTLREEAGFVPHTSYAPLTSVSPHHPKVHAGPITLQPNVTGAQVRYVYKPSQGAPDRSRRPPIDLQLDIGRMAQVLVNGRFAGHSIPWLYKLTVVTVAVGIPLTRDLFLARPDHRIDNLAELF